MFYVADIRKLLIEIRALIAMNLSAIAVLVTLPEGGEAARKGMLEIARTAEQMLKDSSVK